MNSIGAGRNAFSGPRLPQGHNPVEPVHPGRAHRRHAAQSGRGLRYDGGHYTYPDIRLIYWAGGNVVPPPPGHQPADRARGGGRRRSIVHEPFWTAHAPSSPTSCCRRRRRWSATTSAAHRRDRFMIAMSAGIEPVGEARDDYAIFAGIAERLGMAERVHRGPSTGRVAAALYEDRGRARESGLSCRSSRSSGATACVDLPAAERSDGDAARVPRGPARAPAADAVRSDRAGLGADRRRSARRTCPATRPGMPPREWLGAPLAERFPLHLLSNQPAHAAAQPVRPRRVSRQSKIAGREPLTMNPATRRPAASRDGDVVRVFNDRGAFLAGVRRRRRDPPGRGADRHRRLVRPACPATSAASTSTAIRTCSRRTAAPRGSARAARRKASSCRSSAGTSRCRRSPPSSRRRSCSARHPQEQTHERRRPRHPGGPARSRPGPRPSTRRWASTSRPAASTPT